MRIVIAGYYGYRNWGDEGSLAALLQGLKGTASQLSVLSGDPTFTEATYGVAALPRMQIRAVRGAIRASDALIFGGGSLLQDATSLRSLLYYLALIRWGLQAHGKVLLVGQGVGPLRRPISRWLVSATLRRVPFLSVRDADSAQRLSRIGVTHATIDADLTWSLTPLPPPVELGEGTRWIGLAPRRWGNTPVQEAFVALCRQLHADGYRAMLIAMQESQDRALCEAIAAETDAFVLPAPAHPAQLLGVMRSLQGMVALRLHGAIFAASQGVPTLCIAYDPKVDALATQLGAPRVELNRLEEALLDAWQAFQAQRTALEAQLRARICPLRAAATDLLHRVHAFLTTAMGR